MATRIDENYQDYLTQTLLAGGDLLVVWLESPSFSSPDPILVRGQRFGLNRQPREVVTLAQGVIGTSDLYDPLVAPRPDGGFLLTLWRADAEQFLGCSSIPFSSDGLPLAREVRFAPNGFCGDGLVALADGTFATAWREEYYPSRTLQYKMFARLSPLGELIGRPRQINPDPLQNSFNLPSLAGNARGDMTLAWGENPMRARSFSAYGGRLPPLVFLNVTGSPSVAVLANGNRILAGLVSPSSATNYIAYRRFGPNGTPLGPLRPVHTKRDGLFGDPRVAADRFGNFVITWGTLPTIFCNRVEARLFRADGKPAGKEFFASLVDNCEGRPQISFAEDGTFALSWVDDTGLSVAWFSASPGDEPCLARGGRLVCDTGRTGGPPEIDQPAAPGAFDALFLADFDGDGRADPCYHSGTTFRCDLDHRGRERRGAVTFGLPSDLPLMGDVDGDGRAEACVRRGDLLACDTAHDGGAAEFEEHFGSPGDIVLLGDVNGDRRDDLCLFRGGVFLCDVAHDGGTAERTFAFGEAGDLAVLGDFDGDRRDDPCVLRGDTLFCDTKHNGGVAEASLKLAFQPGDGIVFGNLDGL